MGRMSLILVLGFIIIASIIYQTIHETDINSVEQTAGIAYKLSRDFTSKDFIDYAIQRRIMQGQDIVKSYWNDVEVEATITPHNDNLPYPQKRVKITGISKTRDGITKPLEAIVIYRDFQIPNNRSPVTIHSPLVNLQMDGPSEINGADMNLDGSAGTGDTLYGVTLTQADTTLLKGSLIADSSHVKVKGQGSDPSVNKVDDYQDVSAYIDLYSSHADTTVTTGYLPAGIYGTQDSPKIVHLDGDTQLEGDVQGTGVLILGGSFSTTDSASINWNGIVLAAAQQDSNNVSLFFGDSSTVMGSLIIDAPDESNVNMKGEKVQFEITEEQVIPGQDFEASIMVLGSELSGSGGVGDVPTEVKVTIGGSVVKTWSDVRYAEGDAHVDGAWQPPLSSFYYKVPGSFDAGTPITISGRFYSSYYGINKTISSTSNTDHLRVLRNGDSAPGMAGSSGQTGVEDFLEGYITDGEITITENQAIFLFDYNTLNSSYPYDSYEEFKGAFDDTWDPYYIERTPEYEDYEILKNYYGSTYDVYEDYSDFSANWQNDGIPPDNYMYERNVEEEDYLEDKAKWYADNDNRDFQDLVVLADLSVPEEDTPDTVDVVTGSGTITKKVKFQHSEEAYNIATSLITSKIGQSGKSIVQIDWIDKNEIDSN